MKPLVSILIPAYNAEKWIKATLESALNQDYARVEVILVNDGSKDRTLEISKTFQANNLKLIDQPNAGGPAARNTALAHAQGDYIQWLDHDDLLAPSKISEQMEHVTAVGSDRILLSGSFGTFFFRPQKARIRPGPLWRDLTPLKYFYTKFEHDTWMHTTCWLVSRKLTELAGPWWNLRTPDDDGEYFCRIVAASEGIRFIPSARSYWRVGNSASFSIGNSGRRVSKTGGANRTLEAFLTSTLRCIEHFRAIEDTERSRQACVAFLQNRLLYFYPDQEDLLQRAHATARELGGSLTAPSLLHRYDAIKGILGWRAAKAFHVILSKAKTSVLRNWDKLMYDFSSKHIE